MNISKVVRGTSPRPADDPRFFAAENEDENNIPWLTVAEITKDSRIYVVAFFDSNLIRYPVARLLENALHSNRIGPARPIRPAGFFMPMRVKVRQRTVCDRQ
ncbi:MULTISPECIES: hypothetical protein [unclassified Janthinobacterium]|uniref:hypothetical protein n=1 Tax=unclassified Janthinobacterium TaxID=2610881 RepID=UPI00161DC6EF|nr:MULTISPECIES: hypothetical protein [unclassified Janthinobacterium]MBB5367702.1 hypothetical protein [Janthinobacterium sp. K2C7]MBB5379820.1 hypothetical protein [Janthinobacterium sp. K2Li3]MBB5386084.1 hypothetical protein [Janthinobacterium sp. K2E3]